MDLTHRKLLSTAQAAELLGVSVSYLNKQRLTGGGIRYVKIGARVVYDPRDLHAYIEANKFGSTSEPSS